MSTSNLPAGRRAPTPAVENAYAQARRGSWDAVVDSWLRDRALLVACSRYRRPGSLWTFLHQAGHFGQEPAIRMLIVVGASTTAVGADGATPAQAARRRGHACIADLLEHAAEGADSIWAAPEDPALLPSSHLWGEARERTAREDMAVAYGGGRAVILAGRCYYADSFDRALIGWHGTYDLPLDMGGYTLIH